MTMAYWRNMKWGVSRSEITFLEALTTGISLDEETNEKEPQEISFKTTYRVETGTSNVRGVVDKWKDLVGRKDSIIIGSKVFGPLNMKLIKVSVSDVSLSANGTWRSATLSFTFKEDRGSAVNISTSESKGGSKNNPPYTVVDKNDKIVKGDFKNYGGAYSYYSAGNNGRSYGWKILDGSGNVMGETAINVGASSSDKADKKTVTATTLGMTSGMAGGGF